MSTTEGQEAGEPIPTSLLRAKLTDDNMTRWTVTVSKATDISLRSFLAQRGLKKGDISKFVA